MARTQNLHQTALRGKAELMPYGREQDFNEDWAHYAEGETVKELSAALERLAAKKRESEEALSDSSPSPIEAPAPVARSVEKPILEDDVVVEAVEVAVEGYTMAKGSPETAGLPPKVFEAHRLSALQKEPPIEFVPAATAAPELEQEMPAASKKRSMSERDEVEDAIRFEMLIEPISVELGSAFARVIDEFGLESTIRLDRPDDMPRWRSRSIDHNEGVHGYAAAERVIRLHHENIDAVSERHGEKVRVEVRL
jgi:hypothetical protein